MADRETAWFIEWPAHNGNPMRWWAGWEMGDDRSSWTTDPNVAIRFCRQSDAQRTAQSIHGFTGTDQFRFTEHAWIDAGQSNDASQEAGAVSK